LGLKKRGHKIIFIIDDNTLPIHELKRNGNEHNWDIQAEADYVFASQFLTSVGLKFKSIRDFIKDAPNLEYNPQYEYILEATLLKHYKMGEISENLPFLDQKKELIKR